MNTKYYLCLTLIIASFRGYQSVCAMSDEELDKCWLDTMFFGSDRTIVPTNDAEMTAHCNRTIAGVKCVREYSATCITGFLQQALNVMLTNMDKHLEKRCNKPKERTEFLEQVKCFLPKAKMAPLSVCADKHTKYVEIASKMGANDHMPGACCGYHLFKHCVVEETKNICSEGHSQYWDEVFDDIASEAVTFACAEFANKDRCAKLMSPSSWAKFKEVDEATDPAVWHHGYKTPIKFIIDMIKKFHM